MACDKSYDFAIDKHMIVCLLWLNDCLFLEAIEDLVSAKIELKVFFTCKNRGFAKKIDMLVTLSATEAELVAENHFVQNMLYVKEALQSIGLKVQLPMKLMEDK